MAARPRNASLSVWTTGHFVAASHLSPLFTLPPAQHDELGALKPRDQRRPSPRFMAMSPSRSPHHEPDFIIAATTSTSANSRTMDDEGDNASRGDNDTTSGDTGPHTPEPCACVVGNVRKPSLRGIAAGTFWAVATAVVAVVAAGLEVLLGPTVAHALKRAFGHVSYRINFMMMRPRATAAAREAFFAKIKETYERRQRGLPDPPPPRSSYPTEEQSAQATLIPEDRTLFVELMVGMPVPTAHFSLPFTAADGRQTLIAIPGHYIPAYVPGTGPNGIDVYSFWGLEAPDDPQELVLYLPEHPQYTPASNGQPAMLLDGRSGWVSVPTVSPSGERGGKADTPVLTAWVRLGPSSLLPA